MLHHATINKGVVSKRERQKQEGGGEDAVGKVFCARRLFREALAQIAVVVIVVCVEVVVEVVLKSNFCAGSCFPSGHYAGGGGMASGTTTSQRCRSEIPPIIAAQTKLRPAVYTPPPVRNVSTTQCPTTTCSTLWCISNACN